MDLNYKRMFRHAFIFLFVGLLGLMNLSSMVFAQLNQFETNPDFTCLPETCRLNSRGEPLYEPDFNCIQKQFLDPSAKDPNSPTFCCPNVCKDAADRADRPQELDVLFSFFGTDLVITEGEQIPVLINLAITTVLGLVSVYALVYGIYLAGFVRTQATDEETIEKTTKSIVTLFIGFVLAWSFIFIAQLVANIIGIGSLTNLQFIDSSGEGTGDSVIVID